jgi:hypothetical protein
MLRRIAIAFGVLLAATSVADAMTFTWRDQRTVHASGPIEAGDAAQFAALPKFDTLELDSPGGLVGEALEMAANMDARGGIRTVVKPGSSCASACAMALFVSDETRIVYMGGRIGIHSCAVNGTPVPECNKAMAANATAHGVPWGVIEGFGNYTTPSDMLWFGAEDAECWGLMRWSAGDTTNTGIACFLWNMFTNGKRVPDEVTAKNADDILCRMNAGTSRIYVSTGRVGSGFSDGYRKACERIAKNPKTPKYATVDIITWLTLTDPHILALKPGTLMLKILDNDKNQVDNCWKCFTIMGMSSLMHGYPKDGLAGLQVAVDVVKRDTGSVPAWLASRIDIATQAAQGNQ